MPNTSEFEGLYDFDEYIIRVQEQLTKEWLVIEDLDLQPALFMMVQDGTIDWQVVHDSDGWYVQFRKLGS